MEDDIHTGMEGPRVCSVVSNGEASGPLQTVTMDVAAIERENPYSRTFMELEGSRFKRTFIAYGACLDGFILGCQKMLFVDGSHLSGPYKGTLLEAVALDATIIYLMLHMQ